MVFVVIALVVTRLVSRLGAEAERARRRSRNLEQLYQVAQQLLRVKPEHLNAAPLQIDLPSRHHWRAADARGLVLPGQLWRDLSTA